MSESLAEARSHNIAPEIFLRHYRAIRDATTAKDEATALLRVAKKAAKTAGVNLDALRMLERLAALDADEAALRLRQMFQYASWTDLPFGTQVNFFVAPDGTKPVEAAQVDHQEWVAGDNGLAAGKAGRLREDNPHDAGTREYVAWDKAWSRGNKFWLSEQKEIANRMGRNAGRSGGGRKAGRKARGVNGTEAPPATH